MKKLWPDDDKDITKQDFDGFDLGYESGWNARGEADKKAILEALSVEKIKKYVEGYDCGLAIYEEDAFRQEVAEKIFKQILTDLFGEEGGER